MNCFQFPSLKLEHAEQLHFLSNRIINHKHEKKKKDGDSFKKQFKPAFCVFETNAP